LRTENAIADHVYKHGDAKGDRLEGGGRDVSLNETTKRGGKSFLKPTTLTDKAVNCRAAPHLWRRVHLFIERENYNGVFMPGFGWESTFNPPRQDYSMRSLCWQRGLNR
jgi:4-hydroxyphenylpyruvate dioxygenase